MSEFLKKGNEYLLSGDYASAEDCYQSFISKFPEYKNIVDINLEIINKIKSTAYKNALSEDLVSVIVPTYNVSGYIKECLNSIQNQTYDKLEIIVVDDGSTDETLNIVLELSKKDARIKVLQNSIPSGNSGTPRNQGLTLAKGEYIFFVDADDWVDANFIKEHVFNLKKFNAEISSSSGYKKISYDEHGGSIEQIVDFNNYFRFGSEKNEVISLFELPSFPIIWFKAYKASFLRRNKIFLAELKTGADIPFSFKCLFLANKVVPVSGVHYNYRFNRPGSTIERRKGVDAFCLFESYDVIFSFLREKSMGNDLLFRIYKKFLGDVYYNLSLLKSEYHADFKRVARNKILENFKKEDLHVFDMNLNKFWKKFSLEIFKR